MEAGTRSSKTTWASEQAPGQSGLYEGGEGREKEREGERVLMPVSRCLHTDRHEARPVPLSGLANTPSCAHKVSVGF